MITKINIDKLVQEYEVVDFIKDDPIQFPHRYKENKKDCEIAGFVSSLLAYGNRKVFIKKLEELFVNIAQNEPHNFILNFEPKILNDFNYRFGKVNDFSEVFRIMKELYTKDGGLEELFEFAHNSSICHPEFDSGSINFNSKSVNRNVMLNIVVDYFYSRVEENKVGQGFYHMIPNPDNGGAMKRMWMYLRWMVRKGPVDLGLWNFMEPSELMIPLDVHVARISREMGLLARNSNDAKAVLELTGNLRNLDPKDPAKYDFAMFGYGVNNK